MEGQTAEVSFRRVMSRFPTGVTIVATNDPDGAPIGLTVNAFTSVSLEPPLVLVCIGHTSSSHGRLIEGEGFSVNVLSVSQSAIAVRFASEPSGGRFDEVSWRAGPSGHPLISGAASWMECTLEEVLPGGDHSILVGRAEAFGVGHDPPMVFCEGAFGSVGP